MKRLMIVTLTVLVATFSLVGCQPEIDASSTEEFHDSAQKVIDSVDEEDRPRLKMYMAGMMVQEGLISPYDPMMSDAERSVYIRERMINRLDGMTAQEIVEEAEAMDHDWGDGSDFENSDFPRTDL